VLTDLLSKKRELNDTLAEVNQLIENHENHLNAAKIHEEAWLPIEMMKSELGWMEWQGNDWAFVYRYLQDDGTWNGIRLLCAAKEVRVECLQYLPYLLDQILRVIEADLKTVDESMGQYQRNLDFLLTRRNGPEIPTSPLSSS
jgi:hypothetical protein